MFLTNTRKGVLLKAVGTLMTTKDAKASRILSGDFDEEILQLMVKEGLSWEDAKRLIEFPLNDAIL